MPALYFNMKSARSLIIAATLLLAAGARAQDAASDKPYAGIVSRNMFGLLPIPTNDSAAEAPPVEPPPKITPNGIMTIFGRLEALFKVAVKGKPGQPAKDQAYELSVGERQDDIEVLKINQADAIITFNNHGTIQELPLVVAANTPAPAAGPKGAPGPEPGNPAVGGPRQTMSPAAKAAERAAMRGRPGGRGMNPGNPGTSPTQPNPAQPGFGGKNFQPQNNPQPNEIEDAVLNAAKEINGQH